MPFLFSLFYFAFIFSLSAIVVGASTQMGRGKMSPNPRSELRNVLAHDSMTEKYRQNEARLQVRDEMLTVLNARPVGKK